MSRILQSRRQSGGDASKHGEVPHTLCRYLEPAIWKATSADGIPHSLYSDDSGKLFLVSSRVCWLLGCYTGVCVSGCTHFYARDVIESRVGVSEEKANKKERGTNPFGTGPIPIKMNRSS